VVVLTATLAANLAWLLAERGQGAREYAFEATLTQLMATAILPLSADPLVGRFSTDAIPLRQLRHRHSSRSQSAMNETR
jgi:hypothetical protein